MYKKGKPDFDIIIALQDYTLKRWNITGECITTFIGHVRPISCVIYDEKSNKMFSSSYGSSVNDSGSENNNKLICWNVDTGDKLAELCVDINSHNGYKSGIRSICFINSSPLKIASISEINSVIKIWDTNTFTCLKTLVFDDDWAFNVVAPPDGIHIILGGCNQKIKIFNILTGECIETLDCKTDIRNSLEILSSGKYLLASGYGKKLIIHQVSPPFPTRLHSCELLINNVKNTINILSDGTITVNSEQIYQLTINDSIKKMGDSNIIISEFKLTANSKKEQEELVEILLALQNHLALENCSNEIEKILTNYRFDIFQIIITIPRNLLIIIGKYF